MAFPSTASPAAWYHADSITPQADGSDFTGTWACGTSNLPGLTPHASGPSNQVVYRTAGMAGRASLEFNGTGGFMTSIAGYTINPSGVDQPITVIARVKSSADAVTRIIVSFCQAASASNFIRMGQNGITQWRWKKREDGSGGATFGPDVGTVDTGEHTISWICYGTTVDVYLDGAALVTGSGASCPQNTIDLIGVGLRAIVGNANAEPWLGQIQALGIIGGSVTSTERADAEAWVASPLGASVVITGDTVPVTDGTVAQALATVLAGDTVPVTDGTIQFALATPVTGDSVPVTDGLQSQALSTPIVGDGVPVTDGLVSFALSAPVTGDAVPLVDGVIQFAESTPVTGDTVPVTDGSVFGVAAGTVAIAGDAVPVTDGTIQFATATPIVGDSVPVTDGLVFGVSAGTVVVSGDTVPVTDGVVQFSETVPVLGDSLPIVDGQIFARVTGAQIFGDSLALADGLVAGAIATPILGDTLPITDGIVGGVAPGAVAISGDSLPLVDGVVQFAFRTPVLGDSVPVTDGTLSTIIGTGIPVLGDQLTITEGTLSFVARLPLFGDVVPITHGIITGVPPLSLAGLLEATMRERTQTFEARERHRYARIG